MMVLSRERGKMIYRCINRPKCRGSHTAHPDGRPLGVEVPARVRRLRSHVHEVAKVHWPWEDKAAKDAFYGWIRSLRMPQHHIGGMLEGDLEILLKHIEHYYYRVLKWPRACDGLCDTDAGGRHLRHAPACHAFNRILSLMDEILKRP